MHPAKRRRLEQTTATLNKPFRSPLRVDPNQPPTLSQGKQDDQKSLNSRSVASELEADLTTSSSSPLKSKPHLLPTQSSYISRQRQNSTRLISPTRNANHDPEWLALQKQHSALSLELTKLSQSLDAARQALKIEKSNQDVELELLITKWTQVAREAAEELFAIAKDRVNKMGGVGVWREKMQKKPQGWQDDDDNPPDESELTDEQKEQLAIVREEALIDARKYGLAEPEVAPEQDDESFTMDMMLKQMNIELDVIGYDKKLQRWMD